MNKGLARVLEESIQLQRELDALWEGLTWPQSPRGRVVAGYCSIVREHVLSQRHLLAIEHDVTAMTLVRPAFESLVRAIWSLQGAKDEWIERFLRPPLPDAAPQSETVLGPPIDAMLESIKDHHPEFVHQSLAALKESTWKPMHSYVHGGIRPVLQALIGCPEPQQVAMILNSNGFHLFATNVLLIACEGPREVLASIQARFAYCLPPMSPAAPT